MSAPSVEHAKAHAEAAKAAPAGHASEGHVDGSLAALLAGLKNNIVAMAAIPAHVHHEQHHGAAAAGKEGDHPKDEHPKPDHPKAEGAAPAGDHPKPQDGGHGHADTTREKWGDAAPLVDAIPSAWTAWRAGNLQTGDIKAILHPLVDLANTNPLLGLLVPPVAAGLTSLIAWGLGAHENVHEIEPVFETLGRQILGFEEGKDGTFHHSYEGLVTGMKKEKDIEPMNLHFRHFNQKNLFDTALKGDRPTLQKRIASLLGVEGDLNETQVRSLITTLMHRLGGHGHVDTHVTPNVFRIAPHHPLRPTLRAKHEALLKLYENAFNWLDQATLDKIFDDKVPEPDIAVDFDNIGNILRAKVTPNNRERFLNPINAQTYKNDFKAEFAYLVSATTLQTAMKKSAEKEKVLAQLHKLLGLEQFPPMDLPALLDIIKTLRERVTGDPAVAPTDPDMLAKYNAFVESFALVETAFSSANILTDLFGDEKAPTTPIDYANIGQEVLKRTKTQDDLLIFNQQFDENEMLVPYGPLLSDGNMIVEAEKNPDNLKALLGKFFAINGTLTNDKIKNQATLLILALKQVNLRAPKAYQFANVIGAVRDSVINNNILTPRLNCAAIGVDIVGRIHTAGDLKDLDSVLNNMADVQFAVGKLFFSETLQEEIESDLPGVQAQIRNLYGITGAVTRAAIRLHSTAIVTRLSIAIPGYTPHNVLDLLSRIQRATDLLISPSSTVDATVLAKLYGKAAPASFEFQVFLEGFRDLEDRNQTAVAIRGYSSSAFRANLNYLVDPDDLDSAIASTDPEVRTAAVEQIRLFMGQLSGPVRAGFVDTVVNEYEAKVRTVNPATLDLDGQIRHTTLLKDLGDIRTTLTAPRLKALFENKAAVDETPFTINYRQFANEVFTRVNTSTDQKRFLRGFSPLDFEAAFTAFYPLTEISKRVKNPAWKTKAKEQIDALFYPLGAAPNKVSRADMIQQTKLMLVKLGTGAVERASWNILVVKTVDDVIDNLRPFLDEIYADEPEVTTVKPERLGIILKTEVQTKEEAISFLRGYKPSQVRDFFTVLADGKAFDTIVQSGQTSDLAKLQEKLRAFVGMDLGPITVDYLGQIKTDFEGYLNNADPATLPADLKAKYDHIVKLLEDVLTALSAGKRLEKLFNPEVGIDYDDFGATVRALPKTAAIPFLRELNMGLLATNMIKFNLEITLDSVTSPAEREELRGKLAAFLGVPMDAVLTTGDIDLLTSQMLDQFGDPETLRRTDRQAYATYMALHELINTIVTNVTQERLANIYKGAKAKKKVA